MRLKIDRADWFTISRKATQEIQGLSEMVRFIGSKVEVVPFKHTEEQVELLLEIEGVDYINEPD